MNSIEIIETASYLPENKIENNFFNDKFSLDEDWIYKRTGIRERYFLKDNETIVDMAIKVAEKIVEKSGVNVQKIGNILVATTSSDRIMPGISFEIQRKLDIKNTMCLDILAGCSGFINAFDIARKNLVLDEIEYALVIGVEAISKYLDFDDINTAIILGDGAGAVLLKKTDIKKKYVSFIESNAQNGEILTCHNNEKLYMDGLAIYKFAVSKVTNNINTLLEKSKSKIEDVKYIVPHQSNIKIIKSIASKLKIDEEKVFVNLDKKGNTFCASIPIALDDMKTKNKIKSGDKLILAGYGGGLNLGSIFLEF